jgi:hypothetical protein
MAKLTKEEFMNTVKAFVGERDDDEALKFIEDCNDTITGDGDDWKAKYDEEVKAKEELDKSWRAKYKERFYSPDTNINDTNNKDTNEHSNPLDTRTEEEKRAESITINDLFKSE